MTLDPLLAVIEVSAIFVSAISGLIEAFRKRMDAVGVFAVAFVTALFVVRGLLAFVSRHGYAVFGWWRIALGLAALVFFSL